MAVPEPRDDEPRLGVIEDDLVLGEVEAGQFGLGSASDGVNTAIDADHPVVVSELLLLLRSFLMLLSVIGRPWRAGDDMSVVHDAHGHFQKV